LPGARAVGALGMQRAAPINATFPGRGFAHRPAAASYTRREQVTRLHFTLNSLDEKSSSTAKPTV